MTLSELRDLIDKRIAQRPDMADMEVIAREGNARTTTASGRPDGGLYMEPDDEGNTVAVLTLKS